MYLLVNTGAFWHQCSMSIPMSIMDGRNCYAKNALFHPLSTDVEQFLVIEVVSSHYA